MDTLEEFNLEIDELNRKKADLYSEMKENIFKLIFKPFFDKSKRVDSVSWTQYTPYFNDGDLCEFRCNFYHITDEIDDEEGVDWFDYRVCYGAEYIPEDPKVDHEESLLLCNLEKSLESLEEELFKEIYGDHSRITVYRTGKVEVEEYDHD